MTIISEPITDLAGVGDTTKVVFTVDVMRPDSDGVGIITTKRVEVTPVAGVLTTPDLDPGPARVKLGPRTYSIVIPDSPTPIKLWPLLESTVEYTPPVVGAAQAAATAAAGSAAAAAASAASVAGIADTVTTGRLSAESLNNTYATTAAAVVSMPASNGTDDTTTLNATLAAASGKVVRGKQGENYQISAPLVIKSGTTLDMSGCTVTLKDGSNCNLIRNEHYASGRDSNITIMGGTWARGSNDGTNNDRHNLFLRRIDGVTVRNIKVTSSGGKYAIALGDVTEFHVENCHFATSSDGVHITGPARSGFISSIHGTTGDDMVAFTAKDYVTYNDVNGNISGVVVTGVYPNGSLCGIKMIGGTGLTVRNVRITGVYGTTVQDGVKLIDDSTGASDLGGILIDGVGVDPGATYSMCWIAPSLGRDITLRNLRWSSATAQTRVVYVNSPANIETLLIDGLTHAGSINSDAIYMSSGTVQNLVVQNLSSYGAITGVNGVRINTGSTVGLLEVRGVRMQKPSGGDPVVYLFGGTITRVTMTDVYTIGGGRALRIASGITGTPIVTMTDVSTVQDIAQLDGPAELQISNVESAGATSNGLIHLTASATLVLRGDGSVRNPANKAGISRSATQTIRVIAPAYPVDVSILAKNNGDAAYNTNAALACGVGRVVSDGTNWKNVSSGLTY